MTDGALEALFQKLTEGRAADALADAATIRSESAALYEIKALALTMLDRIEEADGAFARAAALDPDEYFVPFRLSREAFDRFVEKTLVTLPAEFREFLQNVEVGIEDVPSEALIEEGLEFDLLGVYIGATAESDEWGFPDRVVLFQRNLENISPDEETLLKEVRDTLLHEVGHHFGMNEDTLREIEGGS